MTQNKDDREKMDIWTPKSTWVEVGRVFEPYFGKHGGVPLLNAYVPATVGMMLQRMPEKFIMSDDGWHYRRIAGETDEQSEEPAERIVFTFRSEDAEQAFPEIEAEIQRDHFCAEVLDADGEAPKDLDWAVSFVNQMSDLYDEEGWRELTSGLSDDLDKSIQTLKRYMDRGQWVGDMLENALSLRELMPAINVWKHYP